MILQERLAAMKSGGNRRVVEVKLEDGYGGFVVEERFSDPEGNDVWLTAEYHETYKSAYNTTQQWNRFMPWTMTEPDE